MQSTFSRKFLGFRAACPLVGETFRALSSSSTLPLLRILYQHEISKHLPPISPRVKGILSRLWKEYCVQHPSGRLVKILKMISVKLFISPPLSLNWRVSLPPKQIRDPPKGMRKWWNQQISTSRWETYTIHTHIVETEQESHVDSTLRRFKLTFGKYGDT